MKRFFAIILLLGANLCHAQVDTVFWFALPAVSSPESITHRLEFQSYDTAATIVVEKIYSSASTYDTFSMGVQQHHRYLLGNPGSYTPNSAQYRGIHVHATASVSCVYDVFIDDMRTLGERYCLKGSTALGTHFLVPAQHDMIDYYYLHNSIELIATEDSTVVVLEVPVSRPGWDTPSSWTYDTLLLQRGQCYIARNDTVPDSTGSGLYIWCRHGSLNGTIIRSNKPIAVNSSDEGNYTIYGDMPAPSGDQIVPVHFLGTQYYFSREAMHAPFLGSSAAYDSVSFMITALYDSTTYHWTAGWAGSGTLCRGVYRHTIPYAGSGYMSYLGGIESDKPIAVYQVLYHNKRPSATPVPAFDCTGWRQIAATCPVDTASKFNYIFFGSERACEHLLENGNPLPSDLNHSIQRHFDSSFVWPYWAYYTDSVERLHVSVDTGWLHVYTYKFGEGSRFYTCHSPFAPEAYLKFDMGFTEFNSGYSIHFRYAYRNVTNLHFTGPNSNIRIPTPGDSIVILTDARSTGWYYLQGRSVGGCHDTLLDSVYIFVRPANNEVYDTVEYQLCRNQLPFTINGCTFDTAGSCNQRYAGSHDCDSIVTYIVTLLPDSDTTLYDTIDGRHLPWSYRDSTFSRPVSNFLFVDQNILGCDSVIHYNLHIIWRDTIYYYICPSQLPFTIPIDHGPHSAIEPLIFYDEGTQSVTISDGSGTDSLLTYIVSIIPNSEAHIYDTIVESQLPWFACDTLFNDTINDYIHTTYNEAGCDSTIHYSLYIYWDGDHCDTALTFGNVVTPNGDGVNDRFTIGGLIENNCFKYNELTIYDRSGHQIYHRKNISREEDWWDPASERIPAGTYFFIFKAHGVNIYTQHQGVIEVLRM